MTHEEIRMRLWALYDGQVPTEERPGLETHLRDCGECRLMFSEWEGVSGSFFQRPDLSDPSGELFAQKVMSQVRALPQNRGSFSWRSFLPWAAPILGSAALALWVLFFLLPQTQGLSRATNEENFFMEDNPSSASTDWAVLPVSSSEEEFVQAFIKE